MREGVRVAAEVADALRAGRAVVALESSVLAQGLPVPANHEAARRMVGAVRSCGAVPAITGVVRGVPAVGIGEGDLARFLQRDGIEKVSARDIPLAMARGADGATTVAASLALAGAAGIAVFATGGIGGVHHPARVGAVRDESADLEELARSPMVVVCAGAKSILDLEGTVERLETLSVPVLGWRTSELPGFFTAETGIPLPARVESVAEVAAVWRAQRALGRAQAVVVMQPPPPEHALPREVVERAVESALSRASNEGARGGGVTPFLLAEVERVTAGSSLGVNLALLERNATLAAEVAVELATAGSG